jgi:hypothetical protein
MLPDITDSKKLYLGAFQAKDSPYDDPQFKVYFVRKFTPLIMRVYVHSALDYEKVVVGLTVNRCKMTELTAPNEDQKAKAKVIRYYDEYRW